MIPVDATETAIPSWMMISPLLSHIGAASSEGYDCTTRGVGTAASNKGGSNPTNDHQSPHMLSNNSPNTSSTLSRRSSWITLAAFDDNDLSPIPAANIPSSMQQEVEEGSILLIDARGTRSRYPYYIDYPPIQLIERSVEGTNVAVTGVAQRSDPSVENDREHDLSLSAKPRLSLSSGRPVQKFTLNPPSSVLGCEAGTMVPNATWLNQELGEELDVVTARRHLWETY